MQIMHRCELRRPTSSDRGFEPPDRTEGAAGDGAAGGFDDKYVRLRSGSPTRRKDLRNVHQRRQLHSHARHTGFVKNRNEMLNRDSREMER